MELSQNQKLVMDVLEKKAAPLSAYMILEELRSEGLKAPLQIYRALEKLMSCGMVHRLESLNAFIACSLGLAGDHCIGGDAFLICEKCRRVAELSADMLGKALQTAADSAGFAITGATVELVGLCPDCRTAGRAA